MNGNIPISCLSALSVWAPIANGQVFNLDVGPTDAPLPAIQYGASADQAGIWNRVDGTLRSFLDVNGIATDFRGAVSSSSSLRSTAVAGLDPGDKELMESYLLGDVLGLTRVSFTGLRPGAYRAFIYAWHAPDSSGGTRSEIELVETSTGFSQVVTTLFGSPWSGQAEGTTYATVNFSVVDSSGLLFFRLKSLGNDEDSPVSVLNGIQIVPIPAPGPAASMPIFSLIAIHRRRGPSHG